MTADKRSIATDALEVLGMVLSETGKDVGRDAIHLACLPATVGDHIMGPGEHVAYRDGTISRHGKKVGIIDPFLTRGVVQGERVLMVLYPRVITSLRHVWSHPDIPDEGVAMVLPTLELAAPPVPVPPVSREQLIAALDVLGRELDPPVGGHRIYAAMEGDNEGFIHFNDVNAHGSIPIPDELWNAYERINGERADRDPRNAKSGDWHTGVHFSCSC